MNIDEKIERSRSSERIDFTKISCIDQDDPLILVKSSDNLLVEPIWEVEGDFEGGMYADYISEHPEYDGVYVRRELYERLLLAANNLGGLGRLVLRAGHRPVGIQRRLMKEVAQDYLDENPGSAEEDGLKHARMYVSDPDIKLPPHCCAAAVDVDVVDSNTGKLIDFGSPVNVDSEISHLHSDLITEEQKNNRIKLLRAMLEAGFSSYYAEWWHFSYGDEIWAWFYRKDACLYGVIDLNE